MGDRYRVRVDAPSVVHSPANTQSDLGTPLDQVEFKIIERKKFLEDNAGLLVLEVRNADAPFVNALRRIMIAEVETFAVDVVGIKENTSIIADELLAHRIGLVPFNCDPEEFGEDDELCFDLYKYCETEGKNDTVLSSDFLLSVSDDAEGDSTLDSVKGKYPNVTKIPAPLHNDIVIAKLIPKQSIFLRARLKRGMGKQHAKWSPVATASYRLMPIISVNNDVVKQNKVAQSIKDCCPANVFDVEDSALLVSRGSSCTMCRECIRHEKFDGAITLERDPHHFIFSIESVGMIDPEDIFRRACKVLARKASKLSLEVSELIEKERLSTV